MSEGVLRPTLLIDMEIPTHPPEAAPQFDRPRAARRLLRIAEWVLLSLLLVEFGARSLPNAWRTLNTDFPNYYLTARLIHEHVDASRVYEWIWIERQKDHREIDQRVVGMVPITAFSTLAVYPIASMPPLEAKHVWIVFNFALLLATLWLLRDLTGLPLRQIALIAALSYPLRVNFMFGQYYVLLLFLLALACFLYSRQRSFASGIAIGFAAGLKVFPAIFLLYFLRKRDFRAFTGGVVAGSLSDLISICTFGWQLHRVYLSQVLPAVLRGEGLDPYNLHAASLSTLLHRLFVFEPQLNPHPAMDAAWMFALLHPLLQMAVVAPALLQAIPRESSRRRICLEWAAILLASLAISTSASSYLFTVLILPACLVLASLAERRSHILAGVFLILNIAAGRLGGTDAASGGWSALLAVPRLYAVLSLCCIALWALWLLKCECAISPPRFDRIAWPVALASLMVLSMVANLRHQRGLYDDYRWRTPAVANANLVAHPAVQGDALLFVALMSDGYRSGIQSASATVLSPSSAADRLSLAGANDEEWVEEAGRDSTLLAVSGATKARGGSIPDAESPVLSSDGTRLAYLREDHGRGRIWIHSLRDPGKADEPVTPAGLNVLEMSFLPGDSRAGFVFSAQA